MVTSVVGFFDGGKNGVITSPYVVELDGHSLELPINDTQGKNRCYSRILSAIFKQMTTVLAHHNKIMQIRFDISISPADLPIRGDYSLRFDMSSNSLIRDIMDKFTRWHKSQYGGLLGYVWVREQASQQHPHWHVVLYVNAQNHQTSFKIIAKLKNIMQNLGIPHTAIHHGQRAYRVIKRQDLSNLEQAFYHASYLAKTNSKEKNKKSKTRNYSQAKITTDTDKIKNLIQRIIDFKTNKPKS